MRTGFALVLLIGQMLIAAPVMAASGTNLDLVRLDLSRSIEYLPLPFTPAFNSNVLNYSCSVSNIAVRLRFNAILADTNATILGRINSGTFLATGSDLSSLAYPLNPGTNLLEVKVTAADGLTAKSYFVTIVRAAGAPSVATELAGATNSAGAFFQGAANPNGSDTTVFFQWGASTNYANATPAQAIGHGDTSLTFRHLASNLTFNTTYHFRAVAASTAGTSYGADQTICPVFSNLNVSLPGVHDGAAAWGDFDNDDRLDVLLAGYASNGPITQVWRNTGAGFSNINAGLPGIYEGAVAWGDFDNDGRLDLVLSGFCGYDTNHLPIAITQVWRNTGSGFSNINAGLPPLHRSAVAWGDFDNDGRLDLVITGEPVDRYFALPATQLWRNTGNGFVLVPTPFPGVMRGSVAWGDYDNDGWLDLLLTGFTTNGPIAQVWRNTGTGFTNINAGLPGVHRSCAAWGDYDNDGRLDMVLAGQDADLNRLCQVWRNTPAGFTNINAGLPGVSQGSVAWGDFDNDGRLDLLIAGGESTHPSRSAIVQVWRNTGARFARVEAGLPGVRQGLAAWGDFDNDGRLDLLLAPVRPATTGSGALRTIYVAARTDGIDGVGTEEDPRNGSDPSVVFSTMLAMDGARVVFGEGHFPLTNTVVYEDNNTVLGAGWGRTVFDVATNVAGRFNAFHAFYPDTDDSTNNVFHGFTIDMRSHLNAGWTNGVWGLTCLGADNLLEVEVANPRGNWLNGAEAFPVLAWPSKSSEMANIGRNVVRSRAVATNAVYPADYLTMITVGGRRPEAAVQDYDLIEDSAVIGSAPNYINAAYSAFGRAIVRDSYARKVGNGVYHETQSGGASDANNGDNFIRANSFENVGSGIYIRGVWVNSDFEIAHNRISATVAGVRVECEDQGQVSNFVALGNVALSAGGGQSTPAGLALYSINNGLVAHNVTGNDVSYNPVHFSTNLVLLDNTTLSGSNLFPMAPAGVTNSRPLSVRGAAPLLPYETNMAGSQIWRNLTSATNSPPLPPVGLTSWMAGNRARLTWLPVDDPPATNGPGLGFNLRLGTTPGGSDLVSPAASAAGFRRLPGLGNAQKATNYDFVPAPGQTVYWSVQAVDSSLAGSPFAAEQAFAIAPATNSAVPGDSNGDGVVDQGELALVITNYWLNAPANIDSVSTPSNGVFQFSLGNLSNLKFNVEVSTNLTEWQLLGPANLFYQIADPQGSNFNQRFYRLVLP